MNKNKVTVISLVIYKIIYEIIYIYGVSSIFDYMGLPYAPNVAKLILSYILFFLVVTSLPKYNAPVSKYLLSVYLIFTMIPLLSFYWQADASTEYMIYCVVSYILLSKIACSPLKIRRDYKIVIDKEIIGKIDIVFVQTLIIVCLLALLIVKYGVADFRALNLYEIYEVRESRSFSGIYGYIINWIPYALVPCLICSALYMKKWAYVVFAVSVQLYMYLFVGSKTALFSIGLILVAYFLVKLKINYIFGWCFAITTLCIFTWVIWEVFAELMPFGIFPVRLLSVPASISFQHYDFFSINPKLYFSENFIGRIFGIESPYDQISTYLVSDGLSNQCTGYLGDAYDNGGFVVMLVYSVILALIFRFIDKIYLSMDKTEDKLPMFVGILTYSMIYLNDGTLTAVLVTGGLLIVLAILKVQESKDYAKRLKQRYMTSGNNVNKGAVGQ